MLEAPFDELAIAPADREWLTERLADVRSRTKRIWEQPVLRWFTKHGVEHSEQVALVIGQALHHVQREGGQDKLNRSELLALLAACYLHDIGMQYLGEIEIDTQLTPKEQRRIREEHPRVARERITDYLFDLGVPEGYRPAVGLIAEAHGSATYESALAELEDRRLQPEPDMKFRGSLLAALLLMGDELHLHHSRATWPQEMRYSAASMMHHYVNSFVQQVRICDGRPKTDRCIHLDLVFPPDSQTYRQDVYDWIGAKLLQQVRRTNPVVRTETNGRMIWCAQINFYAQTGDGHWPEPLPDVVRGLLRRDVLEQAIIDRDALLESVGAAISAPTGGERFDISETPNSETSRIVEWARAAAQASGALFAHVDAQTVPAGHGGRGLVESIAAQLEIAHAPVAASFGRVLDRFEPLLAELAATRRVVIFFQAVDAPGDPETRSRLRSLAEATKRSGAVAIVSGTRRQGAPFALQDFKVDEIAVFLRKKLGYPADEAAAEAGKLHTASGGRPEPLHLTFEQERSRALLKHGIDETA